jgi:hypothetical protein
LFFQVSRFAAGSTEFDSSKLAPPTLVIVPACAYSYVDTYSGTIPGTNPPSVPSQSYNLQYGGSDEMGDWGAPLSLQFNNYGGTPSPSSTTPAVPCAGYYEVAFSIELRNNAGQGCSKGQETLSVAVTSTDPTVPNVYNCPITYGNFCCAFGYGSCCSYTSTPNSGTSSITSCGNNSEWVQCMWDSNYNGSMASDIGNYYAVSGYAIFAYTPWWPYISGNNFTQVYSGQCNGGGCYTGPYYQGMVDTPHTAYCTQKPFYYHTVVYLHQGAQLSAPTVWALIPNVIYYMSWNPGADTACGMSVTGGTFTVNYLHS